MLFSLVAEQLAERILARESCTTNSTTTTTERDEDRERPGSARLARLAEAVQRRGGRRTTRTAPNIATSSRTTKQRVGVDREEVKLEERQGCTSLALISIRINDVPFPPSILRCGLLAAACCAVSRVHLAVEVFLLCGCHVLVVCCCVASRKRSRGDSKSASKFDRTWARPFGLSFAQLSQPQTIRQPAARLDHTHTTAATSVAPLHAFK